MLRTIALLAAMAILVTAGNVQAQQPPPIKRTILQKADVPGTNMEVVLGLAEIAPGVNIGRHTHAGPEQGTVIEGELVLLMEGQPDKVVKVGESYQVPTGTVHDAKAAGDKPVKVIASYVVPKGGPLATPAK